MNIDIKLIVNGLYQFKTYLKDKKSLVKFSRIKGTNSRNDGRLYIIKREPTSYGEESYYIGTTGNFQQRFNQRCQILNELGVLEDNLENITVYSVLVQVNNQGYQPNNSGEIKLNSISFDAEHLLIRIYCISLNKGLRNTEKWNQEFRLKNTTKENLKINYHNQYNIGHNFEITGNNNNEVKI